MQIDPGSIIANPIILGAVVFVIVTICKRLKWTTVAKETLWLTMAVSVLIASIDILAGGNVVAFPIVPATGFSEPSASLTYFAQMVQSLAANAGVILAASQAIYHVLHIKVLLGDSV